MTLEINNEYLEAGIEEAGVILFTGNGPINNTLRTRRKELGLKQEDLAAKVGTSVANVGKFESLRGVPPPGLAQKIAEELSVDKEKLFPSYLKLFVRPRLKPEKLWAIHNTPMSMVETEALETAGQRFLEQVPESVVMDPVCEGEKSCLREDVEEVLRTLTLRERKVIRLLFGIEDGKPRTLEEVGKEFGVTRERIREISAKALRKLRHPARAKHLMPREDKNSETKMDWSHVFINGAVNALCKNDPGGALDRLERAEGILQSEMGQIGEWEEIILKGLVSEGGDIRYLDDEAIKQFGRAFLEKIGRWSVSGVDWQKITSRMRDLRAIWELKKHALGVMSKSKLRG